MAMSLYRIVEHLNKIKYLRPCIISCRVYLSLCNAFFERGKEAFGDRIVMAVSSPTRRGLKIVCLQECHVI